MNNIDTGMELEHEQDDIKNEYVNYYSKILMFEDIKNENEDLQEADETETKLQEKAKPVTVKKNVSKNKVQRRSKTTLKDKFDTREPAVLFNIETSQNSLDDEVEMYSPTTNNNRNTKLPTDNGKTTDECLCPLSDDSDDYDDTSYLVTRDATTEPACMSDMTCLEAAIIAKEDAKNDKATREFAPEDCYNFEWSNDKAIFFAQQENFDETPGPTFEINEQTTVLEIFDKMFDVNFIDRLCTETNRYADQTITSLRRQNRLLPHSKLKRWTPTNRDEMVTFLTVYILQGLYPLPNEDSYFGFNGFGTMHYFSKIMTYNRYLLLKRLHHFADNESTTDKTKLSKIRPVIDYFNEKFSTLYYPSREVVIDESLLKCHGRLSFTQKISTKASEGGVKTYELCEASSGYLWKFFICCGKSRQAGELKSDRPDGHTNSATDIPEMTGISNGCSTTASAKIVYNLIEPLLDRGHTLVMDQFYNSPLLARTLKRRRTDCFGTLRMNREFLPDSIKTLTKTKILEGEVVSRYCKDLAVMAWRECNLICMISTYHHLEIRGRKGYGRMEYKPHIIFDYNKNMGGLDRKDQNLAAQPLERLRCKVWYKKLFRRLLHAALFNCYLLYKTHHIRISHRQFRVSLAELLIKRHRAIDLTTEPRMLNFRKTTRTDITSVTRTIKRTIPSSQLRPIMTTDHFPEKSGKSRRCAWCAIRNITSRSTWKCVECDVGLCINKCFRAYHRP